MERLFKPTVHSLIMRKFPPEKFEDLMVFNPSIQELFDHEFWLEVYERDRECEINPSKRPYAFVPPDTCDPKKNQTLK